MRRLAISLSVSISLIAGIAGFAKADEIVILQMRDGSFYNPTSGKTAPTREALMAALGVGSAPTTLITSETPPASVVPPLIAAIDQAKQMLNDAIIADGQQGRVRGPVIGQEAPRNVTLAVWNKQTNTIDLVKGIKDGTDLILTTPSPADISVHRSNWINSDYQSENPNHIVVAVRYPIRYEVKTGKKVTAYDTEQAVYTPYSNALDQPEVVARGKQVVEQQIADAFTDLRQRNIKSRAQPDKLLADVVQPELVKTIAIIEHADSVALRKDPHGAIRRIYATIGLNPQEAYNYSRSPAGALGVFQFMPATYASLAKQSQYALKTDFEPAMRDHTNAMKAATIYLDTILAQYSPDIRLANADPRTYEYVAAGYNGGYAKIKTAIQIWDDQINGVLTPHEINKRSRLQAETIDYVKKLRNALPALRAFDAGGKSS